MNAKFHWHYISVWSIVQSRYFIHLKNPGTLPFPVAGQLILCLTWSGAPKTGFLATKLIFYLKLLRNLSVIYCCNWTQMFYLLSNNK